MTKQLAVLVENRPGVAAEVCDLLGKSGVNIEGIMLEGSLEFGVLRLHCQPMAKARKVLEDAGFQVHVAEVLVVNLENKPGQLAEVLRRLSRGKTNVESVFGTTWGMEKARIVLRVADPEEAKASLKGFDLGS